MNDAMTTTLLLERPMATIPLPRKTGTQGAAVSAVVKVLAALSIVAVALWILFAPTDPLPESVAVLEVVHGSVVLLPTGKGDTPLRLLSLSGAESIGAGAVIETEAPAGPIPSRAAIRMAGGPSIRLDTDTQVRIDSTSTLVLERGAVYVDSEGQSAVEVRTTLGVVRDVGTQFEVRVMGPGSLRVRVREGRVVLSRDGAVHEAGAGAELRMDANGTLSRAANAVYGPEWDWVLETAPAPDIDGRPLREVLGWVAREGGWRLRFAGEGLEDLSGSTILHGEVEDLTPTEVASMVVKGSDLSYRLEDGTLVVEPASR